VKLLAIDASASLCAAAIFDTAAGVERGRCVLELDRGHAESLIAVIAEALRAGRSAYGGLGAVAVATGPGSFTGLRVSIAAARGFALALTIPALGVANLDAIAAEARLAFPGRFVLAVLDAGRDGFYLAVYDPRGTAVEGPAVVTLPVAAALAARYRPVLAGPLAASVAAAGGAPAADIAATRATADIGIYARLAAAQRPGASPKPIYLRGPDAKPQAGAILPGAG